MRAMKESGIEWIGQIPQEWGTIRAKYVTTITNGSDPKTEGDIPVYGSGSGCFKTCGEYKEGPTVLLGRKGTVDIPQYITGNYWNVDTAFDVKTVEEQLDLEFYYFASTCFDYKYYTSTTTLPSMTQTNYGNMYIPFPPVDVQRRVVVGLKKKLSGIDTLIAAKEKTNALLKERRQSIIYEAVTKGLNPDAPMKDSGIEWIGEIPRNWKVIPLSKVYERMNNGYVGPTRNIFFDSGVRYLQSLHIKEGKIIFEKAPYYVSPEWAAEHSLGTVYTGDVLIVQTGDIGQVACVPEEYNECNCHALIIVTPRSKFCRGEYLSYLLQSHYGRNLLLSCRTGALHPHLNSGNIGSIKLPIPPVDEQQAIVTHLNRECDEYDNAIRQNDITIENLREYRQSIIYEAVTGKIEV